MNNIKDGIILFNNKKYKYKFFDIDGLIDIIRHNEKLKLSLEESVRKYRGDPIFKIFDLIIEYIYYRPDSKTYFYITYKNNTIISTTRLYYYPEKKYGFIDMVYTNDQYRGQGICKYSIEFLINKTKKNINKYELDVLIDNIPARKCYEHNGFKKIRKKKFTQINEKGDKKIIEFYLMRLIL